MGRRPAGHDTSLLTLSVCGVQCYGINLQSPTKTGDPASAGHGPVTQTRTDAPVELPHRSLSDREFEVFRLLVAGTSITDIADGLHLSVKTVSTHKTRILQKMNMASTAELVRYAVENKLVDAGV